MVMCKCRQCILYIFIFFAGYLCCFYVAKQCNDDKNPIHSFDPTAIDKTQNSNPNDIQQNIFNESERNNDVLLDNITTPYSFSPNVLDLGRLKEGEAREIKWLLDRPKDQSLKLGRIWTSCICVTIQTPKRNFNPDEAVYITGQIHTLGTSESGEFQIYVEILEPVKTTIHGELQVDLERIPAKIYVNPAVFQLGQVQNEKSATIQVYNLTKRSIELSDPVCTLLTGKVDFPEGALIQPGESVPVRLIYSSSDAVSGSISGEVLFSTSLFEHSLIRVPVTGY